MAGCLTLFHYKISLFIPNYAASSFFFLSLFRAATLAYRGPQARGQIRATAAAYTTETAMPEPICV